MMEKLSENQNKLQDVTSEAFDEITGKNAKLMDQQKEILEVSNSHRLAVETNLHELMREKGLIRSGQIEVARMIEHLKEKLDESLVNLKQHSREMKQNHDALQHDLGNLQTNAFHLSDKLSDTTEYMLSQNEIASTQFDQTLQRLGEINETVEKLAMLLQTVEVDVNEKLSWITDKIGDTDLVLTNINLVLQHFGFLLLGMLMLVFVNAPPFYRIFFILIVPTNFICTLYAWKHISLIQLSQIIGTVFLCNVLRILFRKIYFKNAFALTSNAAKELPNEQTKAKSSHERENEWNDDNNVRNDNNNDYSYTNYVSAFENRFRGLNSSTNREGSKTPTNASNRSTESRSLTPFTSMIHDRNRCVATTMKGDRCRNAAASIHSTFCRKHEK